MCPVGAEPRPGRAATPLLGRQRPAALLGRSGDRVLSGRPHEAPKAWVLGAEELAGGWWMLVGAGRADQW